MKSTREDAVHYTGGLEMERWEIVVVGAGAAGLMAARAAAIGMKERGKQPSVLLLEGNPKVGKKLLATGNGRCNLTNLGISLSHYHGDTAKAAPLLEAYLPERVLEEFENMGLLCRADEEGRVYPRNLQAAAVLQELRSSCEEAGVVLRCDAGVRSIAVEQGGFRLDTETGEVSASRCVLACGGKASPKHSWEKGGYALAEQLGHSLTALKPSLTYLKSSKKCLRSLKGMRVRAKASLWVRGEKICQESGEALFGDGSLSGICLFNLSACLRGKVPQGTEISLDLLEDMSYREVLDYVERQSKSHGEYPAWELFAGVLNLRVGEELMKELGIPREMVFRELSRQQLRKAAGLCKDWRFSITGTGDWENAQVTAGGVPLAEVDAMTMESKKHPGLYLAGEMLNIDGDCGGYNLHWAWATGLAAGQSAARGRKGKEPCSKLQG